jgi:hypothetical protein
VRWECERIADRTAPEFVVMRRRHPNCGQPLRFVCIPSLSAGIEDPADLIADLSRALAAV